MPKNAPSKEAAQKRPLPTHFLCIPVLTTSSTSQLNESVAQFKNTALAHGSAAEKMLPESAFRPLGTLHLTLGVMHLSSPKRNEKTSVELGVVGEELKTLETALELLQSLDGSNILQEGVNLESACNSLGTSGKQKESTGVLSSLDQPISPPFPDPAHSSPITLPITISLTGLDAFPSPSTATVLYARASDPTHSLHPFCLALRQRFLDSGLISPEKRDLKLHVTIANTIYAGKDKRRHRVGRGKITVDVRELIDAFNLRRGRMDQYEDGENGEYVWASEIQVDRVRICKMGAKAVDDQALGQEYEVVGEKILFPSWLCLDLNPSSSFALHIFSLSYPSHLPFNGTLSVRILISNVGLDRPGVRLESI